MDLAAIGDQSDAAGRPSLAKARYCAIAHMKPSWCPREFFKEVVVQFTVDVSNDVRVGLGRLGACLNRDERLKLFVLKRQLVSRLPAAPSPS